MDRIDAAVIGAGVIGLAIARLLARAGRSVVILEREQSFGTGVSSRSSEVIHAGLYYPPGSLKERLCVAGRALLYAYCAERGVAHRRCGKLVIAADAAELPALEAIAGRGRAAGVADLALVDGPDIRLLEPALRCRAALHSPSTGIVDSHGLMLALLGEAQYHGALVAFRAPVEAIERRADGWLLHAGGTRFGAAMVINAAGLDAQAVASRIDALPAALVPPLHLAKGHYFTYGGRVPFTRLIYPLPVPGGLGTHLTLDLAGGARFGPDVAWVERIDYRVDPALAPRFLVAARRIWPEIDPDRLQPGYAAIRPKLSGPGEPPADFLIQDEAAHGLPGLVNLFGIESPGLTAALAIAEEVRARLLGGPAGP